MSVILAIALLALFLILITVLKYAIKDNFTRTRLDMSALFLFIVATLSISFWPHAAMTLPYALPALALGILLGYLAGVRTERQKIMLNGLEHYLEHFAHIRAEDFKTFTWWSFVNYYSIVAALLLINLVGFTNVIANGSHALIIATSAIGAALIGSILPYLAHLWSLRVARS